MSETITITTRARCIGYGATAKTEQRHNHNTGYSWLAVADPEECVTGGLRTVEREHADYCRIYSDGTEWRSRLYYAGQPVVFDGRRVGDLLAELRSYGEVTVDVEDARG